MGNVPAKEGRSRSYTYSSTHSANSDMTGFISRTAGAGSGSGSRRNTLPTSYGASSLLDSRRTKRKEEKDKVRESHYLNLVVRYDENVDGGFLAPHGTYKSNLDFSTEVVRSLITKRQLAPFYTPLQDFNESWTDEELLILLSQLPLHSIETAFSDHEEEDDIDNHKIHKSANYYRRQEQKSNLKALIERAKNIQKDEENRYFEEKLKLKGAAGDVGRASPELPSSALLLKLYRDATECPICFLYYPRNLNVSRCCVQPICTECFVQIKRLDPHSPHDDPSNQQGSDTLPHTLISEAASCPYCASPEFGVTYDAPLAISTGIGGNVKAAQFVGPPARASEDSDAVLSSSPASSQDAGPSQDAIVMKSGVITPARRRKSLAADAAGVITIDTIRPDWEQKLVSARNKLARKAATASAIHASNLLIPGDDESPPATTRRRATTNGSNAHLRSVEDRMIEEALRLSLLDEEERQRKAEFEKRMKASNART